MKTVSSFITRVPPLFTDLSKVLEGEIDCGHETLSKYSKDGSPYFVLPQAVIYPKNTTDIKHVLSFAREYAMPVSVRGCGGARNGASLGEGIILDMTRYFNHIRNVNMVENTITVDAGVSVGLLLEKLNSWHFDIPLLAFGDRDASIGALVATKSSSPSSCRHGSVREWIESLTVVVDNGEEHHLVDGVTPSGRLLGIYQEVFPLISQESSVLRAAKPKSRDDSTGYNLWSTSIGPRQLIDQLTGSEGTLGIITSVTFRISPHKPYSVTSCIPVCDKKNIPTYVAIAEHHTADSIFLYDEAFMQLSERYHPTLTPFFVDTPYVLLVTHTSNDKEKLHRTVSTFRKAIPVDGYTIKTIDDRKTLTRITSYAFLFSLFSLYTNDSLTPITSCDGIIIDIHQCPNFLTELEDYLGTLGRLYMITGNIGSGHISLVTLFDHRSKSYDNEVLSYTRNIFALVKDYDGGISAQGGEGLARTPFLSYIYNESALQLFKKIKNIWDPIGILNTGKKIHITQNYLQQHLIRTSNQQDASST